MLSECGIHTLDKEKTKMAKNKKQQRSAAVSTLRKPEGTRVGIVEDWRSSGGNKFRKNNCGKTLRDGR